MNVAITGASGFVGSNLIEALHQSGCTVKPISLRNDNWKNQIPEDGDAIIHLAGKAHDIRNSSQEKEYFRINQDLTIAVFTQFLSSNISDFFFFSSVKAVADTVPGILTEETIPYPLTPYGKSKLAAENSLLSEQLPKGKRLFIIRPCMIHGPGNKGNLNLLYRLVQKGVPWPLAAFENHRSFLSIENLCFLIGEMLKNKNLNSGIYNFADDGPVSTNELIKLIAIAIGNKPRLWPLSANFIKKAARLGDIIPVLPLNTERLKKLTENYVVSNGKIKKSLHLEQLPVTATNGLIKTIKSFQKT